MKSYQYILNLSWPIILSNLATPLLGLADTAAIGNVEDAAALGAIALGSVIFNFLYWGFGFLRMGTTGLTAQAAGARNIPEIRASLSRALLIGAVAGLVIILLKDPLGRISFALLSGSPEVESQALDYFSIRLWAAPAVLCGFAIQGWFLGLHMPRLVLIFNLILNLINVILDVLFVVGFRWGPAGVAAGTAIANIVAAGWGLYAARAELLRRTGSASFFPRAANRVFQRKQFLRTISVNRDIMIRTILLVFAFTWFTNESAKLGTVILAANTILLQFLTFAAHFLDGIAFSAEMMTGRAKGTGSRRKFHSAVIRTTKLAFALSVGLTLLFILTGNSIINALTNLYEVRIEAVNFLIWAALMPVIGVWAYQLDGIFIGATASREMRDMSALSVLVYMVAWAALIPLGNHGLWLAFIIYTLARAVTLAACYPKVLRQVGAD